MKWFKSKKPLYSVCWKCSVHFEPAPYVDAKYRGLCPTHREPAMEQDTRKKVVLQWAEINWEKLEELAKKEIAEMKEAQHANCKAIPQVQAWMQEEMLRNQLQTPYFNGGFWGQHGKNR